MSQRLTLSLVAFVIWVLITVVAGHYITFGASDLASLVTSGLNWTFVAAAGFILGVALWQGWRDIGLNPPVSVQSLLLGWLPAAYILVALAFSVSVGLPPAMTVMWVLLNTFFVGLSEEVMFRGVLLQAFRRRFAIWTAVIVTSVMFGAVHTLNVFLTGDLKTAIIQSVAAFLSGLMFIALRLRTGSLWPPIILHGLWDFATFILSVSVTSPDQAASAPPTGMIAFVPVLIVLPNALYGLWLMRNIGQTHTDPNR